MKAFTNANARDARHAATLAQRGARRRDAAPSFAGGGSDLLALVKDRIVAPDVIVNLEVDHRRRPGRAVARPGCTIGGLDHARRAEPRTRSSAHGTPCWPKRPTASRRRRSATSARWPATSASGRGAGTTATASRASRPAATSASRSPARTSSTPSSAAVRATSSIRRTRRRRWWRSTRRSASPGPAASARVPAPEFFALPRQNAATENVLADDEVLTAVRIPAASAGHAQHLPQGARPRGVDARGGQRRRRAGDGPGRRAAARASCSAASRRFRGGCRRWRSCSPGQRITRRRPAEGGRGRGRRRPAAVAERLQGAADPESGAAHHPGTGRTRLAEPS